MDLRQRSRIDAVLQLKPTINNAFVTAMIDHEYNANCNRMEKENNRGDVTGQI